MTNIQDLQILVDRFQANIEFYKEKGIKDE